MPKINFKYNIKKDAWSWVLIAKSKNTMFGSNWKEQVEHIPDNLLSKILKTSFKKAQKIVEKHLNEHPQKDYRELIIKKELICLNNIWRKIEKDFFKTLARVTKKPVYKESFDCFLTTGFMCPYEEKESWFMVSIWHNLPASMTTICHELLHLQFLYHYKSYLKKKGLNNEQIEDLKESLTFLLNEPEFKKFILIPDQGYPSHQTLRKKLKEIWQKEENLSSFLDKAIKIL